MFGKLFGFGKKEASADVKPARAFKTALRTRLSDEEFLSLRARALEVEEARLTEAGSDDGSATDIRTLYHCYLDNTDCRSAFELSLEEAGEVLAFDEWTTGEGGATAAAAARLAAMKDKGLALWDEETHRLRVPDFVLAALPASTLGVCGLPQLSKLSIRLSKTNAPFTPDFALKLSIVRNGRTVQFPRYDGMIVTAGGHDHTLYGDSFFIVDAVRLFMEKAYENQNARDFQWAKTAELLGQSAIYKDLLDDIGTTRFLPATRLSLELDDKGQIRPVFLKTSFTEGEAGWHPILSELQSARAAKLLDSDLPFKGHLPLGNRSYLFLTPQLEKVVDVVRRAAKGDPQKKAAFFANPTREIVRALENEPGFEDIADTIDNIFVETPEFLSQRVEAFGPWEAKTCSFLQPLRTEWFADAEDRYGIMVGGNCIWVRADEVTPLIANIRKAQKNEEESIRFNGETLDVAAVDLTSLELLAARLREEKAREGEETGDQKEKEPKEKKTRIGPLLKTNLEELEFQAERNKRDGWNHAFEGLCEPYELFSHQEESLEWLKGLWRDGFSGALLADDMGLGKTLQCLSFLKWTTDGWSDEHRPSLIVAPVSLMKNWYAETHKYFGYGLGDPLILVGPQARAMQKKARSDRAYAIAEAGVVITSYETVRDKLDLFLNVDWGVMVLDEVQKIKNPTSLLTESVKAVKADFVLAMTGTPVENSFMDLWSIMDAALPGLLRTAREFSENFCGERPIEEAGAELQQILKGTVEGSPSPCFMMRRLKKDRLKDLPKKTEVTIETPMPPAQLDAYRAILDGLKDPAQKAKGSNPKLAALHSLANCCLSPDWAELRGAEDISDEIVAHSAKLTALFNCLDEIAARKEKVIVFVQHLDLQMALAQAIRKRYKLDHLPGMINGSMMPASRQEVVDKFQGRNPDEFDAVVLTGRAAGTGLTLTAANHVIHLERWWNPAVEDQCSARAYRIGQTRDVTIHIPLAVIPSSDITSFDVKLHDFLNTKRLRSESVLMPVEAGSAGSALFETVLGEDAVKEKAPTDF